MPSTRRKLAGAYAAALVGGGILFATAAATVVLLASNDAAEARLEEVFRRQRLVELRADTAVGVLTTLIDAGQGGLIVRAGPEVLVGADSAAATAVRSVDWLSPTVTQWYRSPLDYMGSLPDYLVVFARDGGAPLFVSLDLEARWVADSAFRRDLRGLEPGYGHLVTRNAGNLMVFFARAEPTGTTRISHIVAGTELPLTESGVARVAGAVLLITPFVLLLALSAGYAIAGRPLRPVDQLINEVRAITDGRSLHKRVAVDQSNSELARLATTLNEMVSRLESSFTTLRRFTADASHELNTPLAVLRADIERAMNPATRPQERLEALEEALQEIRRMSTLVDSLLTLARADEGRLELLSESVQLAPVVRDVFETAQLLGEDAGLTVRLVLCEDATVLGDRDRLRQLFLNLITNAIKYTPRGGRVDLSLSRRLDGVAFSVRDTGIGISSADLAHVFDRFWRADRSRSRAAGRGGFGLGLPISHWIAQVHGGTLTAASKLGRGSTFTVTLPYASDAERERAASVQVRAEDHDDEEASA